MACAAGVIWLGSYLDRLVLKTLMTTDGGCAVAASWTKPPSRRAVHGTLYLHWSCMDCRVEPGWPGSPVGGWPAACAAASSASLCCLMASMLRILLALRFSSCMLIGWLDVR